jgi:cytoskeletal protein CcmA (bactofilin family)
MYPRNAASPERIALGAVVQISDGAVQTSGVSVKVLPQGTTASAGGGTTGYEEGIVHYTPTQGETNYTSFIVIAYKTGCIPVSQTIVTSKSATTGYAGLDWGQITGATSTVNLSGTTIATTQKVDVETIKTNPVVNAGTITFPTGATLASTTNITAGTVTTATNVTTVNGFAANVITAASIAADAGAEIADAVWDEALSGHTTAGSAGKALGDASAAGDPWSTALPGSYGAGTAGSRIGRIPDIAAGSAGGLFIAGSNAATTVSITGDITGNVSGSVGSVTGAVGSVTGAVGSVTGNVGGNVVGSVASVTNAVTVGTINSGVITATSIAADAITAAKLAADVTTEIQSGLATASALSTATGYIDTEVAAIKAKTDQLSFTVSGQVDSNIQYVNDVQIKGTGASGNEWGPI